MSQFPTSARFGITPALPSLSFLWKVEMLPHQRRLTREVSCSQHHSGPILDPDGFPVCHSGHELRPRTWDHGPGKEGELAQSQGS